ncbi:MAG TPA: hypothetical protein VFD44_05255 [Hanamia sp.]|jgi:hypothetical protein|nr:hypothetical protein [Hanamia sp.]
MKRKLFAITFLVSIFCVGKGQNPAASKPETIIIKLQTVKTTAYGYLAGMTDTTLRFSSDRIAFSDSAMQNFTLHSYRFYEIEKVEIRKYGSLRKGIIIGGLAGGAFGCLLGPVVNNSLTFGSFTGSPATSGGSAHILTGLTIGLITGAIIGVLAGKRMRKFYIQRNQQKFLDMKAHIIQMYFKPSTKDSSIIY